MTGDLVEVELDDELDGGHGAGPRPARPPRRRWSARAWSRVGVALAVALAAGVVLDGRHAAWLAAPVSGLVADLRVPRHEVWRTDGQVVGAVGDLVVVQEGRDRVSALRVADGHQVWAADHLTACSLVGLEDATLRTRLTPERSRVVCQPVGADGSADGVAILRPSDGVALLTDGRYGGPSGWATVRDRLVVIAQGSPGTIAAVSLETGRRLWSRSVEDLTTSGWYVADDWFVLGDSGVAYDLATGDAAAAREHTATQRTALPGGGRVVMRWSTGAEEVSTTVERADGSPLWTAPVYAYEPPLVVDASAVVTVDRSGTLQARDALSGDVLWDAPLEGPTVAALQGVLVVLSYDTSRLPDTVGYELGGATALVGLDLRTGKELWQVAGTGLDLAGTPTPLSDGERLAVPRADGVVVVRDVRTGEVVTRWPAATTTPSALVSLPDGLVAQQTPTAVVVLAPGEPPPAEADAT